jgi:proteasome lid subunit RPN8/RPN11
MLRISQSDLNSLRAHGEETYPHECCGILLGTIDIDKDERVVKQVIRAGNTRLDSLHNRYNIAPKELIAAQKQARQAGLDIVGFYHSHPDHPPRWSQTDLAEAHWIGCSYVITSVINGKADVTNSFALVGDMEEDKRFEDEAVLVIPSTDQKLTTDSTPA